jgi:predicted dehydrogenase
MFQESKPGQPLTAVIVGAGHRAVIYANFALKNPDKLKIVGIADPNPLRRDWCRKTYGFSEAHMFESAEALAAVPRFADAVINGTMDHQHVATAIPLLKAGYHMLLEKPFAVNEEEKWELVKVAKETDRKVMVCHVLRYAPFYKAIRQKLLEGAIGDVVAIETVEHVSYHHMAVAYVRGKWRNYESCKATMLLAKCSHDLDLIMWMNSGNAPVSVASFGSNFQFHPGRMPEGAGKRCLVDCPREVEENCLYSAKKLFVDHPDRWTAYVWDNLEHLENPTLEDKIKTLKEDSLYGRCIYQCDNDTVDHQTVIINFANGVTASHNMIAGCARPMRSPQKKA